MKSSFIVHKDAQNAGLEAISAIKSLLEAEEPHCIRVYPYKKDRSAMQNSLYWVWLTVIAEAVGETKEGLHYAMKKKHLVRIYERDDPDYAAMVASIRAVHTSGMKTEAAAMARQIVKLTSTTSATVKQFSELLDDIDKEAMGMGIALPRPEDLYYEAMGINR